MRVSILRKIVPIVSKFVRVPFMSFVNFVSSSMCDFAESLSISMCQEAPKKTTFYERGELVLQRSLSQLHSLYNRLVLVDVRFHGRFDIPGACVFHYLREIERQKHFEFLSFPKSRVPHFQFKFLISMNDLFRDPRVVDTDSLRLERKTNEVSKEDDIGKRLEELRNVDIHNVEAPPKFDQLKGTIPDTVRELFASVQNKNTVQIPAMDEDNFDVHSYHTESSLSSKHDASGSKSSGF